MIATLGEDDRPAAGFEALQNIVEDAIIALLALQIAVFCVGDWLSRSGASRKPVSGIVALWLKGRAAAWDLAST